MVHVIPASFIPLFILAELIEEGIELTIDGYRPRTHGLLGCDINSGEIQPVALIYQPESINGYLVLTSFGCEEEDGLLILNGERERELLRFYLSP